MRPLMVVLAFERTLLSSSKARGPKWRRRSAPDHGPSLSKIAENCITPSIARRCDSDPVAHLSNALWRRPHRVRDLTTNSCDSRPTPQSPLALTRRTCFGRASIANKTQFRIEIQAVERYAGLNTRNDFGTQSQFLYHVSVPDPSDRSVGRGFADRCGFAWRVHHCCESLGQR